MGKTVIDLDDLRAEYQKFIDELPPEAFEGKSSAAVQYRMQLRVNTELAVAVANELNLQTDISLIILGLANVTTIAFKNILKHIDPKDHLRAYTTLLNIIGEQYNGDKVKQSHSIRLKKETNPFVQNEALCTRFRALLDIYQQNSVRLMSSNYDHVYAFTKNVTIELPESVMLDVWRMIIANCEQVARDPRFPIVHAAVIEYCAYREEQQALANLEHAVRFCVEKLKINSSEILSKVTEIMQEYIG